MLRLKEEREKVAGKLQQLREKYQQVVFVITAKADSWHIAILISNILSDPFLFNLRTAGHSIFPCGRLRVHCFVGPGRIYLAHREQD